jgi:hypothetical protein
LSLREVYRRRLFDDATSDAERVRFYVRSGELDIAPRADVELMRALRSDGPPLSISVVGPSGAGKTSLIMRVLADLAAERVEPSPEALILRVGEAPEALVDPAAMMKLVLSTIEAERFSFSNVDPALLREATADQVALIPGRAGHEIGIDLKVASYAVQIEESFRQFTYGDNPARIRQSLEDVLGIVAAAGHRPVLVLDDTEKFISPEKDGGLVAGAVENLYNHGVRALAGLPVDLVIAVHPRFEDLERVRQVNERISARRIAVPELPPDAEPAPFGEILARRLERGGSAETALEAVIDPVAVSDLQLLYHDRGSDLRSVLKAAHAAGGHALERGAETIEPRDVRAIVSKGAARVA